MKELKREDFDAAVRTGNDLILLFYKNDHAASTLAMEQFKAIDSMFGKNFEMYCVNVTDQIEIASACSNRAVPEFVSIRGTKIYKRSEGILYTNQILDLLK